MKRIARAMKRRAGGQEVEDKRGGGQREREREGERGMEGGRKHLCSSGGAEKTAYNA